MRQTTVLDYQERILRVLLHIQRNLDGPMEADRLARVAAFSPYHFHRVFRGMVGESVAEHVRRLRLERAAMQLKSTSDPVVRIALDAGYDSHEAFSRAFRAMFGDSPTGFRANRGSRPCGHAPSEVHYEPEGGLRGFRPLTSGGEAMKVEIKKMEPMRVAFMRHVGPYDQCGKVWERFATWAGSRGMFGAGSVCIGLCHDDPEITPPEKIRYDACLNVDESFEPEGEIGVQVIDGGDYAVTTHFGSYDGLKDTYATLYGQWAPQSGRRLRSGPCFEVYLNSPEDTEPAELITDIYVPLES